MSHKLISSGVHFMDGDRACAEAALLAGCRFFAGYPITPASEIAEHLSERLPEVGGVFVQMEDEIASIMAVIGAAYTGAKAMTATSGPGFSLMAESVGLAAMTEAPCVIVDVMRGGPSTGQPTMASQGDVLQAKHSSHGDYEIVALAPSFVQECFDLTIEAFNISQRYRVPVMLLMDAILAHLMERVVVPDHEEIVLESVKRPEVSKAEYKPFKADESLVPPMAFFGEGYRFAVTGLTHDENGYPRISPEQHERLVRRLCDKVRKNADKIWEYEVRDVEDAEVLLLAYGSMARAAYDALERLRLMGFKVGMFRPVTLWPFPKGPLVEVARHVEKIVVLEMNLGQIYHVVKEVCPQNEVLLYSKVGGVLPSPRELVSFLEGVLRE